MTSLIRQPARAATLAVAATFALLTLAACGGGGGGSSSMIPPGGDDEQMKAAACSVGGTVSPGQSCGHESEGNSFTFTVSADGTGCVGGICAGQSISINNFSAKRNNDGSWEVTAIPGAAMAPDGGPIVSSPTFTSAEVIPSLVRLALASDSQLVSDVLDFSENPPARGQTTCSGAVCESESRDAYWEFSLGDTNNNFNDLDSTDAQLTIEPLAEHRGVSLYRLTVPYDPPFEDETYVHLGGWLDHSYFHIDVNVHRTTGRLTGDVYGRSSGLATGTNPLSGSATWSGVMFGRDVSASATHGNQIQGNADLFIDDFAAPRIDVAFTNIIDINANQQRPDMAWDGVSVRGGGFSTGSDGNSVQGQFYGPNHEEIGGTFERDQVIGAFGAHRQ